MKLFLKKIAREFTGNLHKNRTKLPENSRAIFLKKILHYRKTIASQKSFEKPANRRAASDEKPTPDEASAGTDGEARGAPQAATCPHAAADGRHPEGKRDYGTTAPDAPISSFRFYCRAIEGLPATLRDACQRQLCT